MPEKYEIRLTELFQKQDDLPEIVVPLPDFAFREFVSIGRFLQHHDLVAHYERFGSPENPIDFMHENVFRKAFKNNARMGDIAPALSLVQSFERAGMLAREHFDIFKTPTSDRKSIAAFPFKHAGTLEVLIVLNMTAGYKMIRVDPDGILSKRTTYPNIFHWGNSHQYGNFVYRIPPDWSFEFTGDRNPSRQIRNPIISYEITNMGEKSIYLYFEFDDIKVDNPMRYSASVKPICAFLTIEDRYGARDICHLEPLEQDGEPQSQNISSKTITFQTLYNILTISGKPVEFDTVRLITDDETRFIITQQLLTHMET